MVIGLAMLMVDSHWLVSGAVAVAEALSLSELVIALTIVAAGTSLPEVATSVVWRDPLGVEEARAKGGSLNPAKRDILTGI